MGSAYMGNGCGAPIWEEKSARERGRGWSAQAGLERSPRSSVSPRVVAGSREGAEDHEGAWSGAWDTWPTVNNIP